MPRLRRSAGTAAYMLPMWGTGKTELLRPSDQAIQVPEAMPAAQPTKSAQGWNQRVNAPMATAGKSCAIQMPPSNCISMAYGGGQLEHEKQRAELDGKRDGFGHLRLLPGGHGRAYELAPYVAGEQVSGGD